MLYPIPPLLSLYDQSVGDWIGYTLSTLNLMSSLETARPEYRVNEPGMRERQAYVTLLTDDHFSMGVYVLLRSLRNAIKSVSGGTDGRSIVVMVTEVGFSIYIHKMCYSW